MRIGIDIDGVLTNEDDYLISTISKYCYENNIVYDKVIFTRTPKDSAILDNKLDIMIEDSPVVIPIIKDIVKVFCFDARYNRNLEIDGVTRVFSWYDIYSKIKNMEGK